MMKKRILALCFALCMCLALLPVGARSASADVRTGFTAVLTAPTIKKQPTAVKAAAGETVTFKVSASNATSYQWQYSTDNGATWKTWKGKTSASASLTASSKNNGNLYRCVVKNSSGSVNSKKVRLTVTDVKPRILTQPKAQKVAGGKSVTFTVAAGGVKKTYQWQYSSDNGETWTSIPDKTEASLKVKGTETNNSWLYRCVVANEYGSVNSKGVRLTVTGVKPAIITQPAAKKAAVALKATFTVEACGSGLKYQWQYSDDEGATWVKCTETGYNQASFSVKTTRAMDGRLYRCVVKNDKGSVKSAAAKLTVPQYYAILVGEENYSGSNYLPGTLNDMKAMAGMLGGLRSKYKIKKLPDATKDQILNAIASYANSGKSYDVLYFCYSGHGTSNYMGAYQGALYTVDSKYIRTDELEAALSAFPGKVVVLLDSCFSGAAIYDKDAEAASGEALDQFNQSVIDAFAGKTFFDESEEEPVATTRMGELAQSKYTVLTAARYDQTSSSVTSGGVSFGVFTRGLVEGMGCNYPAGKYQGSMKADKDGNSKVTLEEAYNCVNAYVKYWRKKFQSQGQEDAIPQSTQYYGTLTTVLFAR